MVWFLWITESPPSRASAIARAVSETVSMAAESRGMLSVIERVKRLLKSACRCITDDFAGISRTSSKLSPSLSYLRSHSIKVATSAPGFGDSTERGPRLLAVVLWDREYAALHTPAPYGELPV